MGLVMDKLNESTNIIFKKWPLLVYAAAIDVVFFIAYGFFTRPLFDKLLDYIILLGNIVSEESKGFVQEYGSNPSILEILRAQPEFNQLLLLAVVIILTVYVIYVFFQGTAWKISSIMLGKKKSFYSYIIQFGHLNLFWLIFLLIQHILSLAGSLQNVVLQKTNPGATGSLSIFAIIFLIILAYFAFISYALIGKYKTWNIIKKSFSIGVNKIRYVLPAYFAIAVVFFVINYLLAITMQVNQIFMAVLGTVLLVPALTWARIYITQVVDGIEN